jgi:hypothetical protein
MARHYLEAGRVLKFAAGVMLAVGAAEMGVAIANQVDVFKANTDKITTIAVFQKETLEQVAARTARINNDNKNTEDNGTRGIILLIVGGIALVGDNVISKPSNPGDRRTIRRVS